MRVSRVRDIGLLLAVVVIAAIIALQLIAGVGEAMADPPGFTHAPDEPSETPSPGHNNWAGDPGRE